MTRSLGRHVGLKVWGMRDGAAVEAGLPDADQKAALARVVSVVRFVHAYSSQPPPLGRWTSRRPCCGGGSYFVTSRTSQRAAVALGGLQSPVSSEHARDSAVATYAASYALTLLRSSHIRGISEATSI